MQAVILPKFGDPDVFSIEEVPTPIPAADQLLIKVAACGVCGHDRLSRTGFFPRTKIPGIIGHEIAGTIVEIGSLINRFKVGDRIAVIQRIPCGLCSLCRSGRENLCMSGPGFYGEGVSGGYGEYVIASERNSVNLPDHIPFDVASILSCAVGTGLHAMNRVKLQPGDTVLITAASGGVGIHTIRLAKLMGINSIAISSSEEKVQRLYDAGAAHVIISPDFKFAKQVRTLTGGKGVQAVIEIAGTATFASSIRCLMTGGRLILVGNILPGNFSINPALLILKEIEIIGSAHATVANLEKVIDLVANNKILSEIAAKMPLESVCQAHRMMEDRKSSGRIVLLHESND